MKSLAVDAQGSAVTAGAGCPSMAIAFIACERIEGIGSPFVWRDRVVAETRTHTSDRERTQSEPKQSNIRLAMTGLERSRKTPE